MIVLDGKAKGVRFQRKNRIGLIRHHNVFAKREVIMSAGAIATPQLLMLSGIGPKHHLQGCHVVDKEIGYFLPVTSRIHLIFAGQNRGTIKRI